MEKLKCLRCGSTNLEEKTNCTVDIEKYNDENDFEYISTIDMLSALGVRKVVCLDCGHVEFFDVFISTIPDKLNEEKVQHLLEPLYEEVNKYKDEIAKIEKAIEGKDENLQLVKDYKNRIARLNRKIQDLENNKIERIKNQY